MRKLKAFLRGVYEFRSDITTNYGAYELLHAYDCGRDLAHRLTFRYFD